MRALEKRRGQTRQRIVLPGQRRKDIAKQARFLSGHGHPPNVRPRCEEGKRLHIRMKTLREWRQAFARHLRSLGVAANATERSVRGITEPRKLNRIYRPAHPKPGETPRFSTHMRRREDALRAELRSGSLRVEPGKAK